MTACGVEAENTPNLTAVEGFENAISTVISGELDEAGRLIIPNQRYSSWDGKRLQGNARQRVLAYD